MRNFCRRTRSAWGVLAPALLLARQYRIFTLPHHLEGPLEEFIFGVCLEAWEGATLNVEWVWSSDQVSSPLIQTPPKPNSSQFFAPKLTDLGDSVLSDKFALQLDLVTLLCSVSFHLKKKSLFLSFCFLPEFSVISKGCVRSCAF